MERLASLDLDSTSIKELPASIERLQGLMSLNLKNCKSLVYLPDSICNFLSLEWLTLHGCSKLSKLPEDLWYLKRLGIKGTGIHGYRPEQQFINLGDLAQFRSTAPEIIAMVPNIEQNEAVADAEERQDIAESSYVEEMRRQVEEMQRQVAKRPEFYPRKARFLFKF
ncbi:disease resistance protein RUN1-like isoform X2 [Pyrus x bretschneideri]|uniref:disease resistance protein RUN1-like isoform X2 n=1 Tax=Pyrus x bretschneideri TaxID=225117 RepID=UPI00202F96EF|nr:disease resistance protein RUN1-like isoform X2 [Pyrus x bretschneideri]